MDWRKKQTVICPWVEAELELREGSLHFIRKLHGDPKEKKCLLDTDTFMEFVQVEGTIYVYCVRCNGNGHEEAYKSSPIKHPLHPKHTLMFVTCRFAFRRKCVCCEDPLECMFYCCPSCDFAINLACVHKKTLVSIDYPRRHEHTLTLFPRQVITNCNVCALDDSREPIYICPCDFVVHRRCIDLPWSIRISRHPQHRLSFTSSFALGDLICNICRRKIISDYGGYICKKEGCSYFAHSRCATGLNVWDREELEGVPEEVEEEVEPPFERLGDGTIRHFSHKDHPLKLNIEDSTRVYDDSRSCQACLMPIYYGNFYSCTLDCSFILHEDCANLSKRIYHAIHPHPLVLRMKSRYNPSCSACRELCSAFFYECGRHCDFTLNIQCATTYEPLIHNSHMHPLYLTSAPEECRICSICKDSGSPLGSKETFNCIESECNFSLCYECAVLPQKVRYKHDKHFLTLSYGEETSEIQNWCELCEAKIEPGKRFYTCDDYCCVTLHIQCLLGRDRNYGLGFYMRSQVYIIPNNGMTRPECSSCHNRCNQKIVFKRYGLMYCCLKCTPMSVVDLIWIESGF